MTDAETDDDDMTEERWNALYQLGVGLAKTDGRRTHTRGFCRTGGKWQVEIDPAAAWVLRRLLAATPSALTRGLELAIDSNQNGIKFDRTEIEGLLGQLTRKDRTSPWIVPLTTAQFMAVYYILDVASGYHDAATVTDPTLTGYQAQTARDLLLVERAGIDMADLVTYGLGWHRAVLATARGIAEALTSEAHAERHARRIRSHRRHFKKIGRNDPCVCESGKKFKKCCGAT